MVIGELRQEIKTLKEGDKKPPTFVKANKHGEKDKQPHKTRKKRAAEQNAARKRMTPTEIRKHALEH